MNKKITAVLVALSVILTLMPKDIAAKAASLEDTIIDDLEQEDASNLVYTSDDAKNGVIVVPSGTYDSIQITSSVKKATVFLDNVKVTDRIDLFGGSSRDCILIISGKTSVMNVNAGRNTNIICYDNRVAVKNVYVKNSNITFK